MVLDNPEGQKSKSQCSQNLLDFHFFYANLKGESQGHNAIFKGLKITFRIEFLEKKLYHVNQH